MGSSGSAEYGDHPKRFFFFANINGDLGLGIFFLRLPALCLDGASINRFQCIENLILDEIFESRKLYMNLPANGRMQWTFKQAFGEWQYSGVKSVGRGDWQNLIKKSGGRFSQWHTNSALRDSN